MAIGYGEDAFPFSYTLGGQPIGYTIDLCSRVVDELARTVGRHLLVQYVPVAADAGLAAVTSGRIDLECGAITANADRHKVVAFSPIIFVAGTRLLVPRGSKVRGARDLDGKTVVVIAGTADEQVIRRFVKRGRLTAKVVAAPGLDEALAMVADGRAEAMAGEDVLLDGLIARDHAAATFQVVGGFLSTDSYGIAFAKDDPALADAVGRAFAGMAHDRHLMAFYERWFERPTADVPSLHLPMSAQLSAMFHLLGSDE